MEQNLTFADLGLSEEILQALEKKGYGYPTRIQAEAIPEFLQWKDVIAKAPTGTGKTFAFGIPMIEHIDAESEDLQGLILAPTRELAIQICDELRGLLTYYKNIRVAVVYGGAKIEGQIKQLKAHPQIVVATPGRLMDHYKRHTISFDKVQTVVLDEADRMLDMGFFDDVTKIIEKVKNRRNLGLFSATISQEVMTVSWMYQRDEVEITVPADTDNRPDITQYSITCPPLEKIDMVSRLIRTLRLERTIVFCNTKVMCQRLRDDLVRMGLDADCIHGDIPQQKREKTMRTFKEGKLPILIATDVASRGIDVDDVDCVINYDVPFSAEDYVHRIGRTGRAGSHGLAIMLATREDGRLVDAIEKLTKQTFEQKPLRPLSRQARSEMRRASGERPERRGEREIERVDTPEDERLAKERARAYVPPSHRNRDPIFDTPYRERSGASGKPEELRVFERETVRKPRQAAVLLCGFPRRRD